MTTQPLHTLTFEEVEARAGKGQTLISRQGYLICSKDRKFNRSKAFEIWKDDVKMNPDNRPVNAKGKPFTWSYSALNDFDGDPFGCPRRYAAARFYCTLPFEETEAQRWGNRVHKAAEDYVNGLEVTDKEALKEVEKYAKLFRTMNVKPELEIVLNKDMKLLTQPKAWFSKDAWFRIKIDVPVIQLPKISVYDYKTGANIKDDYEQLHLSMASLSLLYPDAEQFQGKLIWTRHQQTTGCPDLDKDGVRQVWERVLPRVQRLEDAWRADNFPARKNGLCGKWCGVVECPHNGRR